MNVWDNGAKHHAADAGNPTWPKGANASERILYRQALTRQIVHFKDGHVEQHELPQREM